MSSDAPLNASVVAVIDTVTTSVASAVTAATTVVDATTAKTLNILVASDPTTTVAAAVPSAAAATMALDPLSHVGDGIFLQTKTAQGIALTFVLVALFLACQQVSFTLDCAEDERLIGLLCLTTNRATRFFI